MGDRLGAERDWPPSTFPYFREGPADGGIEPPSEPLEIVSISRSGDEDPGLYRPSPDLRSAVNTALLIGMPLLLTGEPGCGKTQLGNAVAYALGWNHDIFETKSTSQAAELFYEYDVVGRFHAKTIEADVTPSEFVTYRALGRAILLAHPKELVAHLMPGNGRDHPGPPRRSVVVIDEVDKAPRDFPNDILNEIDRMTFRIPELGAPGTKGVPEPHRSMRPFVVLTSNSEKSLPDAFLRRCIYFHIPPPTRDQLNEIISLRLAAYLPATSRLAADSVDFYQFLRGRSVALDKRPGIAELLNWLQAMVGQGADPNLTLAEQTELFARCYGVVFKTRNDFGLAQPEGRRLGLLDQWIAQRGRQSDAGRP